MDFEGTRALDLYMKSKEMKKEKYYCQMCQRQCSDENGFKCHLSSENHKRKMYRFAENPDKYIEEFSKIFEQNFTDIFRRMYTDKKILANKIYMQYISNPTHIRMNSTKWATLTEFIEDLAKRGRCQFEKIEKGIYVWYVERDPNKTAQEVQKLKRLQMKLKAEKKEQLKIQKQIELFDEKNKNDTEEQIQLTENQQTQDTVAITPQEIKINIKPQFSNIKRIIDKPSNPFLEIQLKNRLNDDNKSINLSIGTTKTNLQNKQNVKQIDQLLENIKQTKLKSELNQDLLQNSQNQTQSKGWICPGIIVKIKDKQSANGSLYKQKGKITKLLSEYLAEIELLDKSQKVVIDQEYLETVIPKIGGLVKVVKPGQYREKIGAVFSINETDYSVQVILEDEDQEIKFSYDDISKLFE